MLYDNIRKDILFQIGSGRVDTPSGIPNGGGKYFGITNSPIKDVHPCLVEISYEIIAPLFDSKTNVAERLITQAIIAETLVHETCVSHLAF